MRAEEKTEEAAGAAQSAPATAAIEEAVGAAARIAPATAATEEAAHEAALALKAIDDQLLQWEAEIFEMETTQAAAMKAAQVATGVGFF